MGTNDKDALSVTPDALRFRIKGALIGAVLGVLIAGGAIFLIPWQFEASGSVKLASVNGQPVESVGLTVQRLHSRAFSDRVAAKVGLEPDGPEAKLYQDSVRANAVRGADSVVELRVRAYSRETARALFLESIAHLAVAHGELANPEIERRIAALRETRAEMENAARAREAAETISRGAADLKPIERFAQAIESARVVTDRDAQRVELRKQIDRLAEGLAPSRTFPTAVVEEPDVPTRPAFPRRSAALAVGLTVGAFLGFGWATWRRRNWHAK